MQVVAVLSLLYFLFVFIIVLKITYLLFLYSPKMYPLLIVSLDHANA